MKRKAFSLLLFAACIISHAQAQTKFQTIEYPIKGNNTDNFIDFYQAEVSDTAIILSGMMYHRPKYWARLDKIGRAHV